MIVATHMGMYMPALRPDWQKCIEAGEPELQVRSRRRVDLLNLRALAQEYAICIGEVIQLPKTDYQFRLYCTREDWGRLLVLFADDIDYTKFKDTPEKKHGDKKLKQCYEAMWSAVFRSFPTGSVYDYSRGRKSYHASQQRSEPQPERVVETVYRTEAREWRMKGADPRELADLMREIDAATDNIEVPSESELNVALNEWDMWLNDHRNCTHGSSRSAMRRCRSRRMSDNG